MTQSCSQEAVLIAQELKVKLSQVEAAIHLLDEGATIPFIARYRKEATNGLNDSQLRQLAERLLYVRELLARRDVILKTIREQNKLTAELEKSILAAETKTRLEDLYLPYRPKRHTKAQLAREAGLEPLSLRLLGDPSCDPKILAKEFINETAGIETVDVALEGAQHILMEKLAENSELISLLRDYLWENAILHALEVKAQKNEGKKNKDKKKNKVNENKAKENKFADYMNYAEPIKKIPSHRALALFRGRREKKLQLLLKLTQEPDYGEKTIAHYFNIENKNRAADAWLCETVTLCWKSKLFPKLELELFNRLREFADKEAIVVFARNLKDLLLAPPAGHQITVGLDPGIRTGIKLAVLDGSGKLLDYTTLFPFAPNNQWYEAIATLAKLIVNYHVSLISMGNGTGSRETERLISDLMKMYPDLKLNPMLVNEAGASIYSASVLAATEFPDLDVSLRGAVSIGRRLQDPLAELVKIEPKSIGVGQYQHDVNQIQLARALDGVVEDCVNAVGVDVNTASISLLTHVSGLNESVASNLVKYREEHGAFRSREELKKVARMGEKAFQQAAGFLRILNGDNPLDASCVHPESYPLVNHILSDLQMDITQAIGDATLAQRIDQAKYANENYGLPTISAILQELKKPGRDPRGEFKTVRFKEGIENLADLEVGMVLEGVVSNVTKFGAFVNIGVHQDGLIHISQMRDHFISDPHTILKAGKIVKVKVIEVDPDRRRISLSMKEDNVNMAKAKEKNVKAFVKKIPKEGEKNKQAKREQRPKTEAAVKKHHSKTIFNTAMADALAKLKRN